VTSQVETSSRNLAKSRLGGVCLPRWLICLALLLILGVAGFVRLRLLDLPLERDEGEYAYAGQLMLQGIPPYKLAYNMKLPGTYAAYALIMASFGETIRGVHLGLLLVNSLTILLIYFLGRRLFGSICGIVAAACFGFSSLSDSVLGLAAHATHFVTFFGVAGTLMFLKAIENRRPAILFWSGLLFGFAFLMKQPGIFYGIFAGVFLFWNELRAGRGNWLGSARCLSFFWAGMILPLAAVCSVLALAGVFDRFWFWTFSYARAYALIQSLPEGWLAFQTTVLPILGMASGFWLLALAGIALPFADPRYRRPGLLLLAYLVVSFAIAVPGLYFRGHYFIPLLAAASLAAGAALQIACDKIRQAGFPKASWATAVVAVLAGSTQIMFHHRALFFQLAPAEASRAIYGLNPFPESLQIGNYIRENSAPGSRIAVIGSEPQIYFYSGRHSATGYIYTYPLMEPHPYALAMQRDMIAQIEAAQPEVVVCVFVSSSWVVQKDSHRVIFDWAENYARTEMLTVGLVDIQSTERTVYRWDEKAIGAIPRSGTYLLVLKRKSVL
jgi:hypothetical protein